jgi:hypothetical protein
MHPSSKKVKPEKVAKLKASKVKNDNATVTTETARHCRRSRLLSSAQARRALLASHQPTPNSVMTASRPSTPVSMSDVRYWLSTKKYVCGRNVPNPWPSQGCAVMNDTDEE